MRNRQRRPRPPLDADALAELALRYVGRFATTQAKLADYLKRKLRERGWAGPNGAEDDEVGRIVERLASAGYVDDATFAAARGRSLAARGYGRRRVAIALRAAGVGEDDGAPVLDQAAATAANSALTFARRRRLGPYAAEPADRQQREKWLAAMVRAGHELELSRRIVHMPPDSDPDPVVLGD